jgi:polyribonucleotide nucleotidyltransferase
MLHYNFPPFSVGETGRMGTPGRREVGHGKLAWRALHPMLPSKEEFPYTLRIVSEILESNGSSSMATVCGGSLAMMDAGVPLKSHIAGIAMGLIKEGKDFVVLSDILGDEDDLGDMDFKVAGTKEGITALQMDLKITSISEEIMKSALAQALQGRLHIIGEMEKALPQSREHLSEHAPQMETLKIAVDKIRDVIGSGGKVIREICEKSGARINIEDDGKVTIAAVGQEGLQLARDMINEIVQDPEVGQIYSGKVSKLVDFGAFVDFMGTSGLLHVSEIAQERVEKVSDHFAVGDMIDVKVVGIDNRGKIRLSRKEIITQD